MTVEHRGHWPGRAGTSPATHDDDDDDARASRDAGPGLACRVWTGGGGPSKRCAACSDDEPAVLCVPKYPRLRRVACRGGRPGPGGDWRSDEDDRGGEATPRARPLVRPPSLPGLPALRPVFSALTQALTTAVFCSVSWRCSFFSRTSTVSVFSVARPDQDQTRPARLFQWLLSGRAAVQRPAGRGCAVSTHGWLAGSLLHLPDLKLNNMYGSGRRWLSQTVGRRTTVGSIISSTW